MRKLHAFFAAALMCAIAVVLCGAPVSAETTCRLAYTAKVQYAPQILALKKGWLSAPGVEFKAIDLGMSTGIAAAEAVVSGSADVAVMGDVPAIIALASARPCVLVCSYGGGEDMHSIIVSEKSGIKAIEDLAGKRIGVHFGSSTHGGIHRFLEKHGLSSSVKLVNTPQKNLVEALISGSIDAVAASEPAPSLALDKVPGSRLLTTLHGLGNDYPLMMVATKSFADAHPEALKALVEGTRKGVDYIKADPDTAGTELSASTGTPAKVEQRTLRKLAWEVRLDDGIVARLEQTANFLNSIGRLKKVPDIRGMAPTDFVK